MGLPQKLHAEPGLADAAAHSEGELAGQQGFVERQGSAVVAAGQGKLAVQGGGVHPDAHGGELKGPAKHRVPHQNVAVEGPVIVVGGPAVVGAAGLEGPADLHEKGGGMVLHPGVLPLLWSERREAVLQLLCGDKGDLAADAGQGGELGKHGPDRGLGLADGVHDGGYGPLEIFQVPVPGGEHLFPVPLVHIDGMEIVGLLIPPDGVHIGVEPLPHGELVAVERHALPLGQGVDHLGVPPGGGNIKSDRPLHTVEVVVEARWMPPQTGGRNTRRRFSAPPSVSSKRRLSRPMAFWVS